VHTRVRAFLQAIGRPGVAGVDRWPEDEAHGEIDGIVGPYAIQHTSIDSLPDGRFADQKFMPVIGDLERELAGKLGFPLQIVWHWSAIQKGQKWSAVHSAIRDWVAKVSPTLPDGRHAMTNVARGWRRKHGGAKWDASRPWVNYTARRAGSG
jgi:hypothetical protein